MEFSNLPDIILYKILGFLPLDDLMRTRRLNKNFQQISTNLIAQTEILDLTQDNFNPLARNPEHFLFVLDLCSNNLKEIIFSYYGYEKLDEISASAIQTLFSTFSCPRLIELKFERFLLRHRFGEILRKNPNLKSIVIKKSDENPTFPTDSAVVENLQELKLPQCDNISLRTFIGQCPNLKIFKVDESDVSDINIFERFFQTHPKLEKFRTEFAREIDLENSVHFWNLNSLRSLRIEFQNKPSDNKLLTKISQHFPKLESLRIFVQRSHGIAELGKLKNLKKLYLEAGDSDEIDCDENFRRVAMGCSKLRIVHLDIYESYTSSFSSETMKSFVRFCPELERLDMFESNDVTTVAQALEVIRHFGVVAGRNLKIAILNDQSGVWMSKTVRDSALKLGSEHGQIIKFTKKPYYDFTGLLSPTDSDDSTVDSGEEDDD